MNQAFYNPSEEIKRECERESRVSQMDTGLPVNPSGHLNWRAACRVALEVFKLSIFPIGVMLKCTPRQMGRMSIAQA